MGKGYLLLNFVGRSVNWGILLGAIFGTLYYLILTQFHFSSSFYGVLAGAAVGILLGGIDGVILGAITLAFDYSPEKRKTYRNTMLVSAVVATFLFSIVLFPNIMSMYSATGTVDPIISMIPVILATIAAGYASQRVAAWYSGSQEADREMNFLEWKRFQW